MRDTEGDPQAAVPEKSRHDTPHLRLALRKAVRGEADPSGNPEVLAETDYQAQPRSSAAEIAEEVVAKAVGIGEPVLLRREGIVLGAKLREHSDEFGCRRSDAP